MLLTANCSFLLYLLLIGLSHIRIIQGVHIDPARVKRGIFGTVTSTVYESVEKRVYLPMTCIYLQPDLPSCRNVRFLFPQNGFNFFQTGNDISPTSTTEKNTQPATIDAVSGRKDSNQNNSLGDKGWAQFLGFVPETTTTTKTKIQTTTVMDSRIVVTYAIRGCKPNNLPSDIPNCPEDDPLELVEIVPTTTVRARMEATMIPEQMDSEIQGFLESAEIDQAQGVPRNDRATKSL